MVLLGSKQYHFSNQLSNIAKWKELHSRSTADCFAEKRILQQIMKKEQVLGRVGVNDATINVDALMISLGFDKDENGKLYSHNVTSQTNSSKNLIKERKIVREF
jgi:hypothetical protein